MEDVGVREKVSDLQQDIEENYAAFTGERTIKKDELNGFLANGMRYWDMDENRLTPETAETRIRNGETVEVQRSEGDWITAHYHVTRQEEGTYHVEETEWYFDVEFLQASITEEEQEEEREAFVEQCRVTETSEALMDVDVYTDPENAVWTVRRWN